jgi:thioredoxin-like negative regulator of GroEL
MSRPVVFQDLNFDTAKTVADEGARLLVVDVTATWCQPCQQMDRTTWVAPEVVQWLSDKTVSIQVDADTEAATPFKVQGVPTIIAFKAGKELDRITGSRPAAALLEWLKGLEGGQTELDRLRATPRTDLRDRLSLARVLVQRGLDDEAIEEFAWLWEHALEVNEAWVGVRYSFLIGALAPLVKRSEKAHARFAALRDLAHADFAKQGNLNDWVTLNQLLGEEQRVVAWAESITSEDARQLRLFHNRAALDVLGRHGAWKTLGNLIDNPVELLREEHQRVHAAMQGMAGQASYSKEMLEQASGVLQTMVHTRASMLVRALNAAGRHEDAQATISEAKSLDPSAEMAAALVADVPEVGNRHAPC